jgi:hypothetical protein
LENPPLTSDTPNLEAEGSDVAPQPVEVDAQRIGTWAASRPALRQQLAFGDDLLGGHEQAAGQPFVDGGELNPRTAEQKAAVAVDDGRGLLVGPAAQAA